MGTIPAPILQERKLSLVAGIEPVQDHTGRKTAGPPSLCNDEGHALGLLLFSLFSFDMSQVLSPFSCKPGSSQQGGSDRSASRNHRVTFLGVILLFPVA